MSRPLQTPKAPLLQIIGSLDPAEGGPVELILQLHAIFRAAGIDMEAVTLDPPDSAFVGCYPFPVHALGPAAGGRRTWLARYRYSAAYPRWLKANLPRYSAAFVHGLWTYHSLGAARPLGYWGGPYFCFAHGTLDPWFRHAYPRKHLAKQLLWWAGDGALMNKARNVLFIAEEEQLLARGAFLGYRVREKVVRFGVAAPPPASPTQAEAFAAAAPDLRDRRYLLYLSRIHPKKGCELLIEAFAAIAGREPDLDLVLAGPDQAGWRPALTELAEQAGVARRIHWPGMLRDEAKWGAFHGCEAFVLLSHQENFGIVVAEALGCGKPVLITDKVNIWREIERHGAGLIDDDTRTGAIRLLQRWAGQSPAQRAAQAAAALGCFSACFDIRMASADILALVQETLGA